MSPIKFRLESIATALLAFSASLLLAACASYSGSGLKPGEATLAEVEGVMGTPMMRWKNPDGSLQLAYPRGQAGFHTYMVAIGADGRLASIANVLDSKNFALIQPGMTEEQVLRILGPTTCGKAVFPARNELVWQWRYLDDFRASAHFFVLFDTATGKVRSTMSMAAETECV
jgi:hypothetical protein